MKLIHPDLLAEMGDSSTTLCDLMLIGPLNDGTWRALSGLDINVTYTPRVAIGSFEFIARTGIQMSAIVSTSDLGVDNAEGEVLTPIATYEIEGFTQEQIDAGALDKVRFVIYTVNYNNLATGRHAIKFGGTIGEIRQKFGQVTIPELRSLSNQLKQNVGELYSLTCRATFGSMPIGTGGGVVEERFPCGFDISTLWVAGAVTSVDGTEPDLIFTDTSLIGAGATRFAPGVVEALTGDNAGQKREVESFDSDTGEVTLQFPFVNAAAIGDTYRIREECNKQARDAAKGCKFFWGADWVNHFRGEPDIPVADTGKLNSPGAAIAGGVTGTGESV